MRRRLRWRSSTWRQKWTNCKWQLISNWILPHSRAVKVNQQPLVRIKVEGISQIQSFQVVAILFTDESRAGVSGVDVKPQVFALTNDTQFRQVIESARRCRAQRRHHLTQSKRQRNPFDWTFSGATPYVEGDFAVGHVFLHGRMESVSPQTEMLVGWQQSNFDPGQHCSSLHRRVGLI